MIPTLPTLLALPDEELNRLAAEKIMGWRETHTVSNGRGGTIPCHLWDGADGGCAYSDWGPAQDRNQSGGLLVRMAQHRFQYWISGDNNGTCSEVRIASHSFLWEVAVPGNGARAETIAALCAWFAMEEEPTK